MRGLIPAPRGSVNLFQLRYCGGGGTGRARRLRRRGRLEQWIAEQRPWEATPGGWTVPGELQGWRFRVEPAPGGVRVVGSAARGEWGLGQDRLRIKNEWRRHKRGIKGGTSAFGTSSLAVGLVEQPHRSFFARSLTRCPDRRSVFFNRGDLDRTKREANR